MAPQIDPQKLQEWYQALDATDSLEIQKLLHSATDKLAILNEVREADEEGGFRLYLQGTWTEADGRTALHVAALRGNVELVTQILDVLSNVELVKQMLDMADDGAHDATGEDQGAGSSSTNFLIHLLQIKDGNYGLDALAMAVINCNGDIVALLKDANLQSPCNPSYISRAAKDAANEALSRNKTISGSGRGELYPNQDRECTIGARKHISNIIERCVMTKETFKKIEPLYSENCDFNFLPKSEFLFHFTFSIWEWTRENDYLIRKLRQEIYDSLQASACQAEECPGEPSCLTVLWKYLLFELCDGQGRTPLHVAVDSQMVEEFRGFIRETGGAEAVGNGFLDVLDSGGRTPLYRAAAKGDLITVKELLANGKTQQGIPEWTIDITKQIEYRAAKWGADLDLDRLSWSNGFKSDCVYVPKKKLRSKGLSEGIAVSSVSSTALHVAIIHKHERIVQELLLEPVPEGKMFQYSCERRFTYPQRLEEKFYNVQRSVTATQLAVLVGSVPIVQRLLIKEEQQNAEEKKNTILALSRSFLLAAAVGNPNTIQAFLDKGYDPVLLDDPLSGETALHYALNGQFVQFHPHLTDFVCCEHVLSSRWGMKRVDRWLADPQVKSNVGKDVKRNEKKQNGKDAETNGRDGEDAEQKEKTEMAERFAQRKGCINLLLEAGVNIWKQNVDKRRAGPHPDAPEEFATWWYEQVSKVKQQEQQKLTAAANAISVVAALVATASYVGPFQPPLGYGDSSVQMNILAVRFFVVCDNLSFFLALVAIMYSLIPSLPLPQEPTVLPKTRILVAIALGFLLMSIICVLVAFAASYLAITPDHGLGHHGLTVATIVCGGIASLIALARFLARLANFQITLLKDVEEIRKHINFIGELFGFNEVRSVIRNCRELMDSWSTYEYHGQ